MLLALLSLGVKNIHLGPTLPAFLSPRVAQLLVDTFGIAGIGTVEETWPASLGRNAPFDTKNPEPSWVQDSCLFSRLRQNRSL